MLIQDMKEKSIKITFGNDVLNVRVTADLLRRFKAICVREGEHMSEKIRKWIMLYVHEHEMGNPQTVLFPKSEETLLYQVLSEKQVDEFPLSVIRKRKTIELAHFINDNPQLSRSQLIQKFALMHGHRVDTVREWARLLDSVSRSKT